MVYMSHESPLIPAILSPVHNQYHEGFTELEEACGWFMLERDGAATSGPSLCQRTFPVVHFLFGLKFL